MNVDILAIDLMTKMLVYAPKERISPIDAMIHPYFNEIRNEKNKGENLEHLFLFTSG